MSAEPCPAPRPPARRLPIDGPANPDRALVIDFDRFVGALVAYPEPDDKLMRPVLAGLDLVRGLTRHSEVPNLGRAAPGVPAGAGLAERFLALTDEALRGAVDLLNEAEEDDPHYRDQLPEHALSRAAAEDVFGGFTEEVRKALLSAEPAEDPGASEGFV